MDFVTTQTYLGDILRVVSDALLGPDIVLLLAFIAYAVFCIGSVIVEAATERRSFKVNMPRFLASLADADQGSVPEVIEKAGLLNRQKVALLTVFDYRTLPGDMLVALVRRLLNEEDNHYQRILNRNNIAVRVAPMLGLMGTLIPLGPGLAALGQNDVATLSSSLIIAFNTTVAGLAAAAVCLVIARIRKTWYNGYMNALESAMASLLHKVGMLQDAGEIDVEQPSDHAFLYQKALKRKSAKRDGMVGEEGGEAVKTAVDSSPQGALQASNDSAASRPQGQAGAPQQTSTSQAVAQQSSVQAAQEQRAQFVSSQSAFKNAPAQTTQHAQPAPVSISHVTALQAQPMRELQQAEQAWFTQQAHQAQAASNQQAGGVVQVQPQGATIIGQQMSTGQAQGAARQVGNPAAIWATAQQGAEAIPNQASPYYASFSNSVQAPGNNVQAVGQTNALNKGEGAR